MSTSEQKNCIGSFIVTEQQKNFTFLRVHSLNVPFLVLEEITIPASTFEKLHLSWHDWIEKKGPNATSWVFYQIDLDSSEVVYCYSFTKENFLTVEEATFLPKLLNQPLELVEKKDWKKIGPAPNESDHDTRRTWMPPKFFEGKKWQGKFILLRAAWPNDGSQLGGKKVDLYFDEENIFFPFPYWIEAGDGYNKIRVSAVDSGKSFVFPHTKMPTPPLQISKISYVSKEGISIHLMHGNDYLSFQIVASDILSKMQRSVVLPYTKEVRNRETRLFVGSEILTEHLQKGKSYDLTIIPVEDPSNAAETQTPFIYK